jgi:hypothetical protein
MRLRVSSCLVALLFLVALALSGCSSNNKGKLEGTKWRSDSGVVEGETVPAGTVTVEFRKNGTLTMRVDGHQIEGKYTLGVSNWVTLSLDEEFGHSTSYTALVLIQGDKMTMNDGDGCTLTYSRLK